MSSRFGRSRKITGQSCGAAIESLEPRAYFSSPGTPDLLITVPGPIAQSAISGQKFGDKIAVNVANNGTGAAKGRYTLTLFASTDTILSSDDSQIDQISKSLNVGAGKNKKFVLRVATLPINLNGAYYVLAQVSGPQQTVSGSSAGTIAITPAHVDLSDTVTAVPATGHIGHKISVTVNVAEMGNIAAKGNLAIAFAESVNTDGSAPITLATVSKHVNLKANSSKTLRLEVPLPLGISSGNQFIIATVDPNNAFGDSNQLNNVSVSMTPVSLH